MLHHYNNTCSAPKYQGLLCCERGPREKNDAPVPVRNRGGINKRYEFAAAELAGSAASGVPPTMVS